MGEDKLNNKQFVFIAIIIILCGIAIIGHDYFLAKKSKAYEDMSILLSEPPEAVEEVDDNTTRVVSRDNSANDPSGKVKKTNVTYNYVGRLRIPAINLNKGFVKYGSFGNNVHQNVAIMSGSQYPNVKNSNFILAAHSGSGWNAFFTNIDKLKKGAYAYVTYQGKEYSYKLTKIYSDKKSDGGINVRKPADKNQLILVTCKRPDYKTYYLVLLFEQEGEKDI